MIKFSLTAILAMGCVMSTVAATDCEPARPPHLSDVSYVKTVSDGKTYSQIIYSGKEIAFSAMQYLFTL